MIPACIMNADVYAARIPRKNQYYRCVEAHFEELVGTWDDRYQLWVLASIYTGRHI